jgi:hypothetical protein
MHGNPHPWRIMTLVFGAVLLCSFGLERLFSPVGDAVANAVDGRTVTLTGTIDAPTARGPLVFHSGGAVYTLAGSSQARLYAGRLVRITGTLREAAARLEIRTIAPSLTSTTHAQ